jgi:hypothetical protein
LESEQFAACFLAPNAFICLPQNASQGAAWNERIFRVIAANSRSLRLEPALALIGDLLGRQNFAVAYMQRR